MRRSEPVAPKLTRLLARATRPSALRNAIDVVEAAMSAASSTPASTSRCGTTTAAGCTRF